MDLVLALSYKRAADYLDGAIPARGHAECAGALRREAARIQAAYEKEPRYPIVHPPARYAMTANRPDYPCCAHCIDPGLLHHPHPYRGHHDPCGQCQGEIHNAAERQLARSRTDAPWVAREET